MSREGKIISESFYRIDKNGKPYLGEDYLLKLPYGMDEIIACELIAEADRLKVSTIKLLEDNQINVLAFMEWNRDDSWHMLEKSREQEDF